MFEYLWQKSCWYISPQDLRVSKRTHLTALLQQDPVPLSYDVYPFSLPLSHQLRRWAHAPDAAEQQVNIYNMKQPYSGKEKLYCVASIDSHGKQQTCNWTLLVLSCSSYCMHFVCCQQRTRELLKCRQETGKPHVAVLCPHGNNSGYYH